MKKAFLNSLMFLVLLNPVLLIAAELIDRIVAVVGSEIVTLSDLKRAEQAGKKDSLNALIREKIFLSEIDRLGITVSDDELAGAIREVLVRNKMGLPELKKELEEKGTSFDQYKKDLSNEIRRMKFIGQVIVPRIRISEEEISKKLGLHASEEDRFRARREIVESKISPELENYLDEVRQKTYVEIRK